MGTYYVAKTGNDTSGNGTSGAPWKTLNKAVESVPAGTQANPTVIILKNGNYNLKGGEGLRPGEKKVVLNKAWLTIQAETQHGVVLRGDMTPGPPPRPDPVDKDYIGSGANGLGTEFLSIVKDGTRIDGLVIECIGGAAIGVGSVQGGKLPDNIIVENCITYWTMGQGINISQGGTVGDPALCGAGCIVRNNRMTCGSVRSITLNPTGNAPDPSTGALRVGYTISALVENNIIDHSFGEGFDVGKYNVSPADAPMIVRNNIIHDSSHAALYLLWSRHIHCYNNYVYHTKNSGAWMSQSPFTPANCIAFRDEKAGTPGPKFGFATGGDYYVYNNVCVGGNILFQMGNHTPIYFGFNTLVAGYYTHKACVTAGGSGKGIFENNIIVDAVTTRYVEPQQTPYAIANGGIPITRQNSWSYPPKTSWSRDGDVYGATSSAGSVADKRLGLANLPELVTTGWSYNYQTFAEFDAAVSDNFDPADYHLTSSAPPRDRAGARSSTNLITPPLMPFQQDYRGAARGSTPDMGWHEASGVVTIRVEAAFSAVPGGLALETGTNVAYTNESVVTGTTVSGYVWTVKKGATTQQTATTTNFAYTFPTAGSWTVTLEVQTPEGNDTATASYTISDPVDDPTVEAVIGRAPGGLSHQVGTTITFTDNSTFHLCNFVSRLWEVKTSPGAVLVTSSTVSPWSYQFNTAGTFTVKLTENASGGLSDTQTLTYTITPAGPTVTADFTASDVDLTVMEGDSITFTNASTASGTTISGYLWTVSRAGIGSSETFTTTNLSYTFNEAGAWEVLLRVDTAAAITATKAVAVTVRPLGGGETNFAAVPKTFALSTSTGVQTVTAAALGSMVPKGVHLKVVGATAAGTAASGALWSEGAAMTGAQWAHARFSADGEGTSVAKRARSSGDIFLTLDGSSITGRGEFVRFVPGGMEINITDAPPAAYLAEATFYAGETCAFRAGEVVAGTVDGDTRVETGIAADAVYMASSWAESAGVVEADAEMSRGWAVKNLTQMHLRNEDRDAQATTTAVTRHLVGRIGSSADGSPGFTTIWLTAMDATGFTVRPKGSSLWRLAGWFAFATGGPVVALSAETLATTSPSEHALAFDAQTVMALVSTMRTADAQLGGVDAVGLGWWITSIHDAANQTLSVAQAVGADTSATRSLSASGFRAVNHDGGNLWHSAGSLGAAGVSLAWTAAPVAAYKFLLLAIEKGTDSPVSDLPIARFEVEFDIDPRSGRVAAWFDSSTSSGNGEEIAAWLWDFGDETGSDEANPFHLYEATGSYDVSLTVTTVAGSDTITKTALIVVAPQRAEDYVMTLTRPLASGGAVGSVLDENLDHSHDVRLDPAGHFRALRGAEVTAFLAAPADETYVLVAYDQDGHRFLIKGTDGTMRQIAATTV